MKVFKNKEADIEPKLQYQVMYVVSDKSPHKDYYIECLPEELDWALKNGDVFEFKRDWFARAHGL